MTTPQLASLHANVSLTVELTVEPHVMLLTWALTNHDERTIYLYDRPTCWTRDGMIDDPDAPYRFIRDRRLRVLIGAAPLPRISSVTVRYLPQCTAVAPGATHQRRHRLPIPVEEHSVYWSRSAFQQLREEQRQARLEPATIQVVDVLVEYLVDQPGLVRSDGLAGAVDFKHAIVVHEAAACAHAARSIDPIAGFRRRDIESRPLLQGEEPEPIVFPEIEP